MGMDPGMHSGIIHREDAIYLNYRFTCYHVICVFQTVCVKLKTNRFYSNTCTFTLKCAY